MQGKNIPKPELFVFRYGDAEVVVRFFTHHHICS